MSLELTQHRRHGRPAGDRRDHQAQLLRPVLRRGRRARQQRPVPAPHHAQLPEPRGLQARRGAVCRRVPDGRALHRRHGRRTAAASPPPRDVDYDRPSTTSITSTRQSMTSRVYYGFGKAEPERGAGHGPEHHRLAEDVPARPRTCWWSWPPCIHDPVTTTDELIPSGETSSYRSNPLRLAEFTLSRRVPDYVGRAKDDRRAGGRAQAGRRPGRAALPSWTQVGDADGAGEEHPVRLLRVCQQARRRLRPGAGGLLPEGAGRLRQHLL